MSGKKISKQEMLEHEAKKRKKTIIIFSVVGLLLICWLTYATWDTTAHPAKSTTTTTVVTKSIDSYIGNLDGV